MRIIIRRDDNEMEATYDVNELEMTIYDLKEKIAENNFGPIVEEQRLEYNNKRLKNSHFLNYYNVKNNCVIILKQQSASTSSSNASSPSASDDDCEILDNGNINYHSDKMASVPPNKASIK